MLSPCFVMKYVVSKISSLIIILMWKRRFVVSLLLFS